MNFIGGWYTQRRTMRVNNEHYCELKSLHAFRVKRRAINSSRISLTVWVCWFDAIHDIPNCYTRWLCNVLCVHQFSRLWHHSQVQWGKRGKNSIYQKKIIFKRFCDKIPHFKSENAFAIQHDWKLSLLFKPSRTIPAFEWMPLKMFSQEKKTLIKLSRWDNWVNVSGWYVDFSTHSASIHTCTARQTHSGTLTRFE